MKMLLLIMTICLTTTQINSQQNAINGYTYGTGTNQTQGCELDQILHEEILQRAVELAKAAWITTGQENLQALMQVGQRSE